MIEDQLISERDFPLWKAYVRVWDEQDYVMFRRCGITRKQAERRVRRAMWISGLGDRFDAWQRERNKDTFRATPISDSGNHSQQSVQLDTNARA